MRPLDLERKLRDIVTGKKVLITCVGNPIRGDDGAAQLLASKLAGRVVRLGVLDCESLPQNCLDKIMGLGPRVVTFVNAVDRSLRPGTIVLDEIESVGPVGSSLIGHKFPIAWAASILKMMGQERDIVIDTVLVGVQIGSTRGGITTPVRRSVGVLLRLFERIDSVVEPLGKTSDQWGK